MTSFCNFALSPRFFNLPISISSVSLSSKAMFLFAFASASFISDSVGGLGATTSLSASALNLNSTIPNIFFENENIDLNFFLDFANVWEVDYNDSLNSNKIRSATGISVNWFSVIGPLSFSYAIPLSEANTDITEKFRFQIGTSF